MIISLETFYTYISPLIFFSYWFIVLMTIFRIVIKKRPTSYIVAWLLIIYMIPIIGVILYFLLGDVHLGQKRAKKAQQIRPIIKNFIEKIHQISFIYATNVSPVATSIFQLCKYQTGLNGITGNNIELIDSTDQIFKRIIEDINQAQTDIKMVFYIWNSGGDADRVEQALIQAAQRGVKCRIMLDSAGSRQFFKTGADKKMREAGIEIIESLKVNLFRFMFRRLDLRQHRKIIIIDNYITYTGSMNIVDPRFFKQNKNIGKWIDIMIRMHGPITTLVSAIYASDWELETSSNLSLPDVTDFDKESAEKKHTMQIIPSGPGYTENMIHQALLTAVYSAQEQIIFTTPYLVPSDDLLHAICTASQRGVEVIIIVPKNNDSFMVKWASRAFFTTLLESGVKLYEFRDNLLHTKSVLVDRQLSLVGTVNLDMRSLWLNFEVTAVIDDDEFADSLNDLLQNYLSQSDTVSLTQWSKRPFWQPFIERLFYFFAPLL